MFVFSPGPQPVVPIEDEKDVYFPVHRIYCVGRNYREHDREMGGDGRGTPCFFTKPADGVVPIGPKQTGKVHYPSKTKSLHHEVELVIAIGKGGKNIPVESAMSHIFGWAVGVDLTRRDLQAEAKAAGRPWTSAKYFDESAPISHIRRVCRAPAMTNAELWLYVNNQERQRGHTSDMIWSIPEIISALSELWTLQPGDLIFTGSPSGVSDISCGDLVRAGCNGVPFLEFELI